MSDFPADEKLLAAARRATDAMPPLTLGDHASTMVYGGDGVSGTVFCDNATYRQWVFQVWKAQCVDMESAAIAQVCWANKTPCLIIRGLSDLAGGQAGTNEVNQYLKAAADYSAQVLVRILQNIDAPVPAAVHHRRSIDPAARFFDGSPHDPDAPRRSPRCPRSTCAGRCASFSTCCARPPRWSLPWSNGARRVFPVLTVEEAFALRRDRLPDALLGGERGGVRIDGFDLGNSPREYTFPKESSGRDVITTTTNGTVALRACTHADAVLAAGFVNLDATAAWLQARRTRHRRRCCWFVPAPAPGSLCEDGLCAGRLVARLARREHRPAHGRRHLARWPDCANRFASARSRCVAPRDRQRPADLVETRPRQRRGVVRPRISL